MLRVRCRAVITNTVLALKGLLHHCSSPFSQYTVIHFRFLSFYIVGGDAHIAPHYPRFIRADVDIVPYNIMGIMKMYDRIIKEKVLWKCL